MALDLLQRLRLDLEQERMICITGSGGKTSLLYYLGRCCACRSIPAALLTTTHIRPPQDPQFPLVADSRGAAVAWQAGRIPVLGAVGADGKLGPPPHQLMEQLARQGALLVVEADGSRMLPAKFPNATEPVLPPQTSRVVTVAGLSALGRPLREVCHRWELACQTLGFSPDQAVTPADLAGLLLAGYGRYRPAVLLNQADTARLEDCRQLEALLRQGGIQAVASASLMQEGLQC